MVGRVFIFYFFCDFLMLFCIVELVSCNSVYGIILGSFLVIVVGFGFLRFYFLVYRLVDCY